jgi:membrane protein YdbS with pleckstrin-like domain
VRTLSPGARWVWGVRQALAWAVLLVLALVFGDRLWSGLWLLALLGLLVLPAAVSLIRWRRWRWDVGEDGIDIRHGTLTERRTLIPWIRVQHVDTRRGIAEQLLGLATVVVHTAAGAHEIPLLDAAEAELLRERIGAGARRDD